MFALMATAAMTAGFVSSWRLLRYDVKVEGRMQPASTSASGVVVRSSIVWPRLFAAGDERLTLVSCYSVRFIFGPLSAIPAIRRALQYRTCPRRGKISRESIAVQYGTLVAWWSIAPLYRVWRDEPRRQRLTLPERVRLSRVIPSRTAGGRR